MQHIEAVIAEVERRKDAIRQQLEAQLREADNTLAFLRRMLSESAQPTVEQTQPKDVVPAPESSNGVSTLRIDAPRFAGIDTSSPSIPGIVMKAIQVAGSFLHRSEIDDAFAAANMPVKPNSLSAVLSTLGKTGKLVKVRFDHTFNTIHWGLPEWMGVTAHGEKYIMPGRAPHGPIASRFRLEDAKFDV